MTTQTWKPSNITNAKYLGPVEFQDEKGEWYYFELLQVGKDRIVFGSSTNTGFLESGYILKEEFENIDETLSELLSDLQAYYNYGPDYATRIVCNERM